jgi:hypothetical protein
VSASWEVQVALYNALNGDSTFMNLISSRIYDEPPTDLEYPYVVIGNMTETPDNRHSALGYSITATFTIYTKPYGLGSYQCKNILSNMNRILNMKSFTLTSYTMLKCYMENAMHNRETDINGKMDIRTIDARYRILCH